MTLTSKAYPRAAIIGNPSDGYFGKTIAFVFSNFEAEAILTPAEHLTLRSGNETVEYRSLTHMISQVVQHGMHKNFKLIEASLIGLKRYAVRHNIRIPDIQLSISIDSSIPMQQGLAGSSAIIIAILKGILEYYGLHIEPHWLADIALKVETEIIGITGGLQDRVAQVYERPMYMNFNHELLEDQGYGHYIPIARNQLPFFFIAYKNRIGESSDIVHSDLRERYERGDQQVVSAMHTFGKLTEEAYHSILDGSHGHLSELMNKNFDLRASISDINADFMELINLTRSKGHCAKFPGSGGAIIGIFRSDEEWEQLSKFYRENNIECFIPEIVDRP